MSTVNSTGNDSGGQMARLRQLRGGRAARSHNGTFAQRYGVLIALVGLIVLFSALRPDTFATGSNVDNILNQTAVLIVLSCGLTVVLVLGDFDLSIGAVASIAGVLIGTALVQWEIPLVPALLFVVACGAIIGLVNGLFVTVVRVSAFIATLAMGSVIAGIEAGVNEGALVQGLPDSFLSIARDDIGPVSSLIVISLGIALALWLLLERTVLGRQMYAIGESEEAARLAGVRVVGLRNLAFVMAGALAALAGLLLAARSGASSPGTAAGLLLPAYSAAFLGASVLKPGEFHILGTVIGVLLSSVTVTGLTMLDVPFWIGSVVQGCILLIAISISRGRT